MAEGCEGIEAAPIDEGIGAFGGVMGAGDGPEAALLEDSGTAFGGVAGAREPNRVGGITLGVTGLSEGGGTTVGPASMVGGGSEGARTLGLGDGKVGASSFVSASASFSALASASALDRASSCSRWKASQSTAVTSSLTSPRLPFPFPFLLGSSGSLGIAEPAAAGVPGLAGSCDPSLGTGAGVPGPRL